ncbi:MAG: hypothetical protein IKN04_08880 [Clostridia bacterium]|nr:hypothetical protein [Clostridia bacterium]
MATIANWNGHTFEVSPKLIRGLTDLTIKGSCETTDKNSDKQKYVEHKYGEIPEISTTVELNALTGVTDVMKEALEYVQEATDGATAYFYLGSAKLLPAKMMLTKAEIVEIVHMPGQGDKWISCKVKLTFKQGTESDGKSSSGGSGSSSQKPSVKAADVKKTADALANGVKTLVTTGLNFAKGIIDKAKEASRDKLTGGLEYQNSLVDQAKKNEIDAVTQAAPRVTQTTSDSSEKVTATTGRARGIAMAKKLAQKVK